MKQQAPFPGHVRLAEWPHAGTAAGRTSMDVIPPAPVEDLVHGESGQQGPETLAALYAEDENKVLLVLPVVEETVITDLPESEREHMHHEAPDEFRAGKGELPVPVERIQGGKKFPAEFCGKAFAGIKKPFPQILRSFERPQHLSLPTNNRKENIYGKQQTQRT